jgi:hypothetical protein
MAHCRVYAVLPASIARLSRARADCAFDLQRSRQYPELVRTKTLARVALASEVVCERACGQLRGRSRGSGGIAPGRGKARGRLAVGALAAMEYLGEVAIGQSAFPLQIDEMCVLAYQLLEAQLPRYL